jgi:hypothetical protein
MKTQKEHAETMLRFLIIIILICSIGTAQDPPSIDGLGPTQPIIFPELPKASYKIDMILLGSQNGSDLNMSAWDQAWQDILNETRAVA